VSDEGNELNFIIGKLFGELGIGSGVVNTFFDGDI